MKHPGGRAVPRDVPEDKGEGEGEGEEVAETEERNTTLREEIIALHQKGQVRS